MIRIARANLNSSYYPDWYTDKDFATKYIDGRGYTEYYVRRNSIPDYLWEAFTRWEEYMTYAFIAYAYVYIPTINAGSAKLRVDTSKNLIVFKYKIVQSAIPDNTISEQYVGKNNVADIVEQTHADIDKWLNTWTSSEVHAWLCEKIAAMICDELFAIESNKANTTADEHVYSVLSSYIPLNKSEFYNLITDDRSVGQYSTSKSELTLYLADFDIETLWSLYIACWNNLQGVEQYYGHYKIENIF